MLDGGGNRDPQGPDAGPLAILDGVVEKGLHQGDGGGRLPRGTVCPDAVLQLFFIKNCFFFLKL